MITDMFAGSNQSVNLNALISSMNAGAKASKAIASDDESSKPIDFASLLSQTMDSCFSADPQLVTLQGSNQDSAQESVSSVTSSSFTRTSFNLDTYSSSPFINMSERNSFQSSFDVASSRNASQTNANLSSDKNEQTVSKETQKVEKEDSDSNVAKEASEKEKNVQDKEETQVSEENEGETDVELSMTADSTEEAPVIEVAASTDEASEEIQVEAVSTEETQLVEESTVQVSEESENTEVVVEAAKVEETEAVVETAEVEEADDSEETKKEEVAEEVNTNTEMFAQAQQNTAKVESKEEVEIVEVEATDTENKVSEVKLAAADNSKDEETEVETEDDTETKETAESDKLANAVSQQVKSHDKQEKVFAAEDSVEAEGQEVASNLNHQKKAEVSEEKVVEEATDSEAVEVAAEDSEAPEKQVAKSDDKSEKESKFDEIVETLKEDDSVVPQESLRKEFARLTGQDNQTSSENADTAVMDQTVVAMEQQASQAAATADSTADETADKIFAALTEKLDGVEGKGSKTQVIAGGAEGANKGFNMNQNNGSGMNNGFSFQSGSSQTYDASGKIAQPQSAPAMNFSELLTKAEMVKTKDGAKVMNIEVDQEGVGKLELELISKDGEVTARLSAESDMAKIKLEEIAPQIKENLHEKGVNLTQISVDVSSKNADDNRNEYQSFGRKNKSARLSGVGNRSTSEIIRENILPNLRRQALNIQSVDITV